jgi:predicted DNA-binding antitoxin AbrB/MazE fold protein
MLIKPTGTTDNFDLSWIQRDVLCWIYFPQEDQGPIYTKGVIKNIQPLSFNKGNSKVTCITETGIQHETKASNLEKRRHSNSI